MSDVRRPFPEINSFRTYIMDEFIRRKDSYPLITAPFVRLTSTKSDPVIGYKFFTLGLHGYTDSTDNLFDLTYGGQRDLVGYAYSTKEFSRGNTAKKIFIYADDLTFQPPSPTIAREFSDRQNQSISLIGQQTIEQQKAYLGQGAFPIPGITSVQVTRRALGAPIVAQVQWVCYTKQQLEFLRHHFMTIGGYAVIEWGQMFHDKQISSDIILDFGDPNIITVLKNAIRGGKQERTNRSSGGGRNYIIDNFCKPANGNYDFMVGSIGNFNIEFDAARHLYTITTVIYSTGENIWGIRNDMSFIDHDDKAAEGSVTTIHDFFKEDSYFTRLIEDVNARNAGFVADFKSSARNADVEKNSDIGASANNPYDQIFIQWDYFAKVVIPEMFNVIRPREAAEPLKEYFKISSDDGIIVGNSAALLSTRPETMVIVRADKNKVAAFQNGGYFGEREEGIPVNGAKFGRGIWLNAGMIKRAFASAVTFEHAFRNILIEMNIATEQFWELSLFYDEDEARYRIVDRKYGTLDNFPVLYKFNVGAKGELIGLTLDTAFPPELTTQLALIASFKSESPERQAELLKKFPLIGTTSHFAFALNWTNLTDLLGNELKSAVEELQPESTTADATATQNMIGARPSDAPNQVPRIATNILGGTSSTINAVQTVDNPGAEKEINRSPIPPQSTVQGERIESIKPGSIQSYPGAENVRLSPETKAIYNRSKQYDATINRIAQKYNLDPLLLKALIAQESRFNLTALRQENQLTSKESGGNRSYGLMQILGNTARDTGYNGSFQDLQNNPDVNIEYGAKYFSSLLIQFNGDTDRALSAYNAGPKNAVKADGVRWKSGFCERWAPDSTPENRICEKRVQVPIGQYPNQGYVNSVKAYYLQLKFAEQQERLKAATAADATRVTSTLEPKTIENTRPEPTEISPEQEQEIKRIDEISKKFGNPLLELIEPNPSRMLKAMTKEGIDRGFGNGVAPFPTSAKIELTLLGISGISPSDAFLVDKLPFIYDAYGCFQTVEITDQIDVSGWKTQLRGIFKLMWFDGSGYSKEVRF